MNMNKTCARCQKVVYPIEELKCLDKTWHKTCFKCTECGMALNMKTYKGFNKLPYCEAHIPKAKATAIADTPELKRIAENTKIQSNVKYHADFEKAKGKFTQVADDPETLRIKQNTKIISNVAYHGDLEKKAAMEKQRGSAEVSDSSNESEYFSEQLAAEQFSQYASTATPQRQLSPTAMHSNTLQQHQVYEHQQQTLPPPPIQHQQQNTAAIIPTYQHQQQHQQPQQTHREQQKINHEQQFQHYQQPQALRQQVQQQQQKGQQQNELNQQQQSIKQTSHLYPAAPSTAYPPQPNMAGNVPASQQHQAQAMNNYNQLRSTILQSSHHPTGGASITTEQHQHQHNQQVHNIPLLQQVKPHGSNNMTEYDQQDNHLRYSATATNQQQLAPANNVVHLNNNNNINSISNNTGSTSYQQQQQQQQQQQHLYSGPSVAQQQQQQQQQPPTQNTNANFHTVLVNSSTNMHPSTQQLYAASNYNNTQSNCSLFPAVGGHPSNGTLMNNMNNSSSYHAAMNNIGKIADYDPLTDGPRAMPNTARSSTTLVYSSDTRGSGGGGGNGVNSIASVVGPNAVFPKRIGSVSDIDPANGIFGSLSTDPAASQQQQQQQLQQKQQQYYQQIKLMQQQEQQLRQQQPSYELLQERQSRANMQQQQRIYRALYDYEAQDVDEVSFREGDVIIEVESIDSGWLTGRVERTGKTGMLPANYVEQAVI